MRKIIATAALPYANGNIHIGHLVEYLQVDFWTRFQKMRGHTCAYICADDTHGTPIMVRARNEGRTPEALIEQSWKEHTKDFSDFQIQFDNFGSTNSSENKTLSEEIYIKNRDAGHTRVERIQQLYCNHDKMFLPDRFVKGTCPKCSAPDQYGDNCEKCSSTYSPTELKSSYCSICGNTPVLKDSDHILFKLNDFKEYLKSWVPEHTQKEISNKMQEWLSEDLKDWDISRDEPYFGFKIPGYDNKYFYVWVDAPIGYISSTQQWCQKTGQKLEDFWKNKDSEIYHFIGKDIVYFHTLFWPAMLKNSGYRSPNHVFVHGMLTVNGEKMSKSKGTGISARTYLNHLDPAYLRYYYACKLSSAPDDLDLNLEDFVSRVNSDLIGKYVNLGSRGAQMLTKKLNGQLVPLSPEGEKLVKNIQSKSEEIAKHYENRDFSKAITEIRSLVDEGNKYFDEKAPWKTLETQPEETQKVVSAALNAFRVLTVYLSPILPELSKKVSALFNEPAYTWQNAGQTLTSGKLNDYSHLMVRIEADKVKAMVEETRTHFEKEQKIVASVKPKSAASAPAETSLIEFDDFAKIDLRVVEIIEAEEIKEADKLLKLKVSLGDGTTKQIIAGIKSAYKAADLIGRKTVIVANLKPRQMKFGISEGMVLAAGNGGKELYILSPDNGAKAGDKVK